MTTRERNDRVHVSPLSTLQIRHASPNEISKASGVEPGEVDMASLAEAEEGQDRVFVGAIRDVAGTLNAEAVELRRYISPGNHSLHVVHRHGCLCDVDDAREERHGIEGGRRPVAR